MVIERLDASDTAGLEVLRTLLRDYADHVRRTAGVEHICLSAFEDELARLPDVYSVMLLAHEGADAAGCALLKKIITVAGEPACELKRLWVVPACRGRHLGRDLMERLAAEGRALGFKSIYLDTIPSEMPQAVALYLRMGFRPVDRYNCNGAPGVEHYRMLLGGASSSSGRPNSGR